MKSLWEALLGIADACDRTERLAMYVSGKWGVRRVNIHVHTVGVFSSALHIHDVLKRVAVDTQAAAREYDSSNVLERPLSNVNAIMM